MMRSVSAGDRQRLGKHGRENGPSLIQHTHITRVQLGFDDTRRANLADRDLGVCQPHHGGGRHSIKSDISGVRCFYLQLEALVDLGGPVEVVFKDDIDPSFRKRALEPHI